MATWFSVNTPDETERLIGAWSDAPIENAELIGMLLEIAREQVEAYAPAPDDAEPGSTPFAGLTWTFTVVSGVITDQAIVLSEGLIPSGFTGTVTFPQTAADLVEGAVPNRYVYAQLQQARNLWNAGRTDGSGEAGVEGYSFQPRPLDKTIRSIIRPTSGAADVF